MMYAYLRRPSPRGRFYEVTLTSDGGAASDLWWLTARSSTRNTPTIETQIKGYEKARKEFRKRVRARLIEGCEVCGDKSTFEAWDVQKEFLLSGLWRPAATEFVPRVMIPVVGNGGVLQLHPRGQRRLIVSDEDTGDLFTIDKEGARGLVPIQSADALKAFWVAEAAGACEVFEAIIEDGGAITITDVLMHASKPCATDSPQARQATLAAYFAQGGDASMQWIKFAENAYSGADKQALATRATSTGMVLANRGDFRFQPCVNQAAVEAWYEGLETQRAIAEGIATRVVVESVDQRARTAVITTLGAWGRRVSVGTITLPPNETVSPGDAVVVTFTAINPMDGTLENPALIANA